MHPQRSVDPPRQIAGVDLTRPVWLPTEGAVALAPLTLWKESFLVVACYSQDQASKSKVFRLVYSTAESMSADEESYESIKVEDIQTINQSEENQQMERIQMLDAIDIRNGGGDQDAGHA